jgi:large subunit ribosomal protein L4
MKVQVLKLDNTASDVDFDIDVKSSENLDLDLAVIARVKAQAEKQGTKKAKGRAEVRGHAAKPFKQKGTGRGRQGSTKGPHHRGGGISHGAKQDYTSLRLNKRYKSVVLKRFLVDLISNDRFSFVELDGDKKALRGLLTGDVKTLVVYAVGSREKVYAVRNLPNVELLNVSNVSPFNIVNYQRVLVDVNSKEEILNLINK